MRAARVDDNQAVIVAALRAVGASVTPVHMVGKGFPDVVCGYLGVNYLIEIKDGDKPPSARRLTPAEADWHRDWRGSAHVVCNVSEALAAIGARFRSYDVTGVEPLP